VKITGKFFYSHHVLCGSTVVILLRISTAFKADMQASVAELVLGEPLILPGIIGPIRPTYWTKTTDETPISSLIPLATTSLPPPYTRTACCGCHTLFLALFGAWETISAGCNVESSNISNTLQTFVTKQRHVGHISSVTHWWNWWKRSFLRGTSENLLQLPSDHGFNIWQKKK
jgi:hypothetical protein